jgi:hypothetical protein
MKYGTITLLVLLCSPFAFIYGLDDDVEGQIVLREGKTVAFVGTKEGSRTLAFRSGPEDKKSVIPWSMVKEIAFGDKSMSARIVLKDGRIVNAKPLADDKSHWGTRELNEVYLYRFDYIYMDDITKKKSLGGAMFEAIANITFGDSSGMYTTCPSCKAIWPHGYLYCPNDGQKTKLYGE